MLYLDASAIVKLVTREPETDRLVQVIGDDPATISSEVSFVEVVRAVRRVGRDAGRAETVIGAIALVPIDAGIIRSAAELGPTTLRSLDAIHLATVLSLSGDVSRLVTYDDSLADAARSMEVDVSSPGADEDEV
ncbi:MAG TPA: type II toxin-antitoxin system VapC family toxin [Actinomycetota bacterium]|nr:type II toxin-antitoxin system VapC family toxin [Actinomycetota bacterium]